jgi:hypothetical protein
MSAMLGLFGPNDRPLLAATIKAVIAIAVLSVLATHYLAESSFDQQTLTRMAAEAMKSKKGEPVMTGSINRQASNTRLDPCTGAQKP